MKNRIKWVVILLLGPALWSTAFGQRGIIRGVVKDEAGEPMQEASVKIKGPKTLLQLETNKKGSFFCPAIEIGTYNLVAIEKEGYRTHYESDVEPGMQGIDLKNPLVNAGILDITLKKVDPDSPAAKTQPINEKAIGEVYRGIELQRVGSYERAIEAFRRASEEAPDQSYIWHRLAKIHLILYRNAEAIAALDKAAALEPALARGYRDIALDLLQSDKIQEAEEVLERAVKVTPEDAESHYLLGYVLNRLERVEEAISHFKKYGEIAPDGPNAKRAEDMVKKLSSP